MIKWDKTKHPNRILVMDFPFLSRIQVKLKDISLKLEKLKNTHRIFIDKEEIFEYLMDFSEDVNKLMKKLNELK